MPRYVKLCKIFCNGHKRHIADFLLLEYHTVRPASVKIYFFNIKKTIVVTSRQTNSGRVSDQPVPKASLIRDFRM